MRIKLCCSCVLAVPATPANTAACQRLRDATQQRSGQRAGTPEQLHATLADATAACPRSIVLWLMRAKEQWLAGDVPAARAVLEAAHGANPDSEELFLAAFKLEFESGEPERAQAIAGRAQAALSAPSARVWLKAALVARALGRAEARHCPFACMLLFVTRSLDAIHTASLKALPVTRRQRACMQVAGSWSSGHDHLALRSRCTSMEHSEW